MINELNRLEVRETSRETQINRILTLRELNCNVPVVKGIVDRNEARIMACMHRRWFSSSRKEKQI